MEDFDVEMFEMIELDCLSEYVYYLGIVVRIFDVAVADVVVVFVPPYHQALLQVYILFLDMVFLYNVQKHFKILKLNFIFIACL